MTVDELLNKCAENGDYTIYTSICKAQRILMQSCDPICSISGGADSDIVLDLIHKIDEDGKVTYFWIDTGLEYSATKEHLKELEQKYGIKIVRLKPDKPIPTCVKQYGVPFLSKYVSEQMMRLQAHGFQWEDKPLEVLLEKYPKCKTALQWWCGERYSDENGIEKISQFSIKRNRFLKEFIIANPPDFPISNKCCEYAKKKPAKQYIKEMDADLEITGLRKSEGGIRSANFKTCFSESKSKGCNTYRPLFWYMDGDKKIYEEHFDIQHSRCYTEYGLKRTGCVGCPFSKHINDELAIIEQYEPNLYKAAINLFGKSYEYTAKYRAFVKEMKAKEKEEKKRDKLLSSDGVSSCAPDDSSCCDSADWSTVSA
jgi:3'-phosphoadenosine 5'-phosphosulfate sulfotransferase (PAPS reductase)/FAD synthetase